LTAPSSLSLSATQKPVRTKGLRFGTKNWDTVHVLSSQALGGFGRAAIGLETSIGPIAFEVDQKAIDALRRDLTAAEQLLRTSAD